jgi:hypothetical protein
MARDVITVFISYAHEDAELARAIQQRLEASEQPVTLEPHAEGWFALADPFWPARRGMRPEDQRSKTPPPSVAA